MIYCDGRGSYEVAQRMSDDGPGQRAHTASFPRRSASANDDRRACPLHLFPLRLQYTVESLLTHTARWTSWAMGYGRLWGIERVLKIDLKKPIFFSKTDYAGRL